MKPLVKITQRFFLSHFRYEDYFLGNISNDFITWFCPAKRN